MQRAIAKPFARARRRETSTFIKAIVLCENSIGISPEVRQMPEIDFHRSFHPLTSHPFDREDCGETPPCSALRPYVRCFWDPVV